MTIIARFLTGLLLATFLPMTVTAQSYYQPYAPTGISRAEFVRMTLDAIGGYTYDGINCFRDVTNQYFAPQVCAAKQRGIVTGIPDGRFLPDQSVTFIEAAAIVVRAKGAVIAYDAVWYAPYLRQLATWNAIPASVRNLFDPISSAQAQELVRAVVDGDLTDDVNDDDSDDDNTDDVSDADDELKLTVSSDDEAESGDRITFTIRIENLDNDDQRVDISAKLDDDMTFVDATRGGDDDEDTVEWDNLLVREGDTEEIELEVRVRSSAWTDDTLRLRVEAEDVKVTKGVTVKNSDVEDIELSLTDSDDPIARLGTITYRIRIENNDNDDIEVNVRARLDADVVYVSSTDDGVLEDDDEVRWEDIEVQEDEMKTILLTVRLTGDAKDGDTLRLRVDCEGVTDTETTKVEDEDDDDDDTNDDEDVNISITDSPDPAEVGDIVRYRITVRNSENSDISLDVIAELDEGMTFYSATQGGDESNDEVRWDNLAIDEDDSEVLLLDVRINDDADDGDTLRLRVEAGNDSDTESTEIED